MANKELVTGSDGASKIHHQTVRHLDDTIDLHEDRRDSAFVKPGLGWM